MADVFSREKRSDIMSRVKNRDTKPELIVRSTLHKMGYRFRLHRRDLPGNPDIVLPKHKKVIFVHGCFWHGHKGCPRSSRPSSNKKFWNEKIDKNIKRDKNVRKELKRSGWDIMVIWQCEIKDSEKLQRKLTKFLAE